MYQEKYLKYKHKYLNLKEESSDFKGGVNLFGREVNILGPKKVDCTDKDLIPIFNTIIGSFSSLVKMIDRLIETNNFKYDCLIDNIKFYKDSLGKDLPEIQLHNFNNIQTNIELGRLKYKYNNLSNKAILGFNALTIYSIIKPALKCKKDKKFLKVILEYINANPGKIEELKTQLKSSKNAEQLTKILDLINDKKLLEDAIAKIKDSISKETSVKK
jgi:hypothetical protein